MFKSLLNGPLIIIFIALISFKAQCQTVPNISVVNEFGVTGRLMDSIPKDGLLIMGFYQCHHMCSFIVKTLAQRFKTFKEYPKVTFLSVDENEGPRDALSLKKRLKGSDLKNWNFFLSDKKNIKKLVSDLSFEMKRDPVSQLITHENGVYFFKDGKVFKKFSSMNLNEKDFTQEEQTPASLSYKEFCSAFDPSKSKYGQLIMKTLALFCLFFIAAGIFFFRRLRKVT